MQFKVCSKCKENKVVSEFHKNKARYDGLSNYCKVCSAIKGKKIRQENPDKNKERCDNWRKNNKEKWNEISRNNRIKYKDWYENYYIENAEKERERKSQWKKDHPHKSREYRAKRRALERNAKPIWADDWIISEIYELAALRTEMTSIEWHVDHIIPLVSDLVCGLHTEHNLRVITAKDNYKKNNKFVV